MRSNACSRVPRLSVSAASSAKCFCFTLSTAASSLPSSVGACLPWRSNPSSLARVSLKSSTRVPYVLGSGSLSLCFILNKARLNASLPAISCISSNKNCPSELATPWSFTDSSASSRSLACDCRVYRRSDCLGSWRSSALLDSLEFLLS